MNLPKDNHELLKEFASFLSESGLSAVSIKNYLSDLRNFFTFLEVNGNPDLYNLYLNISKYNKEYQNNQRDLFTPTNTINRRLASIRRLTTFLKINFFANDDTQNQIVDQNTSSTSTSSNLTLDNSKQVPSPTSSQKVIDQFSSYLKSEKKTHSTIKNYCSDLYHYFNWIAKHTPFNTHHLKQVLSKEQLSSYVSYLKLSQTTSSVISRRQSSVKRLTSFCHKQGYIDTNPFEYVQTDTKLSPLSWLKRYLPKPKSPHNAPKNRFAKIYYNYHQLSFTPYLHLALLVIATTTMALLAYNQVIKNAKPSSAATSLTPPKRQLSFQGRLSDSVGTPIVTTVNVNFKLWDQLSGGTEGTCTGAGGEDCLYKTGTCSVTPDNQGIFNTLIGDGTCGAEIPQSVFSDHQDVFLEVGVGAETLTPRQQIATVGYALNSETLQGYPAANPATINSVPVIDNNGDINISVSSPSIISTSGNFTITGESVSVTTEVGSGGDIVLQPDALGSGQILAIGGTTTEDTFRVTNANLTSGSLISGYVGNDVATGSGNLLLLSSGATETAKFRVTADGRTTITTATTSAITAALTIDQNGTGDILTGSASGVTKFNISNSGAINIVDGVAHTIDDVSGDLTLTSNSSNITLNDNVTFAGTTTLNGQTYTWPASAGSNTYVLQTNGSGTLSWVAQTGGGDSYWGQANGTLYPLNSTVDFLLGGQATSSAKFAVLNMDSGTPTATIAGTTANVALFYDGNGNISTTNRQSLVLGNSSTYNSTGNILLSPNGTGFVGIGTTAPTALLDIAGDASTSGSLVFRSTNPTIDILNGSNLSFATSVGGDSELTTKMTLLGTGRLGLGTTTPTAKLETLSLSEYLSETLTNGSLTSGTSWSQTGDMALSGNVATYTHSAGSGTLTQTSGNFATSANSNRLYELTYTISAVSGTAPTATITTAFAQSAQSLTTDTNGTYRLLFRSASIPGNFVISVTSGAAGSFTIDNLSLREISSNILAKTNNIGDQLNIFDGNQNTNLRIADAGTTTLKPTAFSSVLSCAGANCTSADTGTFSDNTAEAKSNSGTPFTTTDTGTTATYYAGLDHVFNQINFDIDTASSGLTLVKEYWNGSAWTTLSDVVDGTTNLTTDGTISFSVPTDWTTNSVNSGTAMYFVRLRSSTNIATAPTAYTSSPTNSNRFYVYGQSGDTNPSFYINDKGNVSVGNSNPQSLFNIGSTSQFQIDTLGRIVNLDGVAHTIDDVTGNLTLTSNSSTISLNDSVTFASTTTLNSQTYTWPGSAGSSGYVLQTNGSGTLSWVDINTSINAASMWQEANGSIYPKNSTVDFLFGGQATTSAKFAVLNVNSGTPVASISSGLSGVSSFLTADGILATTNNQTLTIGNSTTGNIAIATGTKSVAVDSNTWDVTSAGVASGFTSLSSSGTINFSGLTASTAVYTDGSSNLTSIAPTTGILGFWQRASGALAPWLITDSVNIGANSTASALVHLGGTTGESSFFMEPLAIGFNTAITNPGIGGGTTALQVDGDILPGIDDDAYLGRASTAWSRLYLSNGINNSAGTEQISIANRHLTGGQWNATSTLRVGDTTNSMPTGIEFYVVGDASVSATFTAGGNSRIIGDLTTDGNVTVGGGTGKLDVGTVDPPYTINGEKYATYLSGMIGVKEETTGSLTTNEYIENIGYRKTINFNNQANGSDLWLFSKTTNLKDNLSRMSVLLTPNSQAKTWYEIDKNNNTLYIYSSAPGNISYRFSAPRFDDAKWQNTRTAGVEGFVLNDQDNFNSQNISNEEINYSIQIAKIDEQFKLLLNNQEKIDVSSFSNSLIANLRSGLAVINELVTDNLVVKNKLISPIANIGELNAINATISGTLTADNIKSKTIDKLNEQLDLINEKYSTASAILTNIQNRLSQVENDPLQLSPLATTSGQLPEDLTNDSLSLQTLYTSDILANGSIFTQSLSSFETDLFIQPTGDKPVHILANLLNLYPNGQVVVSGDLLVTGNVFANNLDTRTATISGTLALGINNNPLSTDSGKLLAIFGNQGQEVSSIDASGSANFNTLQTSGLVIASQNVLSSSVSGNITSNSTIGTATIATGSAEIFIQNNQVNPQTLIYITPVSDTSNQVLFVKSKQTCNQEVSCTPGFTVAVPQALEKETAFNYWLVQTK